MSTEKLHGATDVPPGRIGGSSVPGTPQIPEAIRIADAAAPSVPVSPAVESAPPPSPEHGLKPDHFRAVSMLLSGESPVETAKACGCSRSTLARWRNEPRFAAYYNERLLELHETLKRKIQVLALESGDGLLDAHRALRDLLTDEHATPFVRNSAASNLMKESRKWIDAIGYGNKVDAPEQPQSVPVAPARPVQVAVAAVTPPPSPAAAAVPAQEAAATEKAPPPLKPEKPREPVDSADSGREPVSGKRESKRATDAAPVPLPVNGEGLTAR